MPVLQLGRMTRLLAALLLLVAACPGIAFGYGLAELSPPDLCRAAIAASERQWSIPDRLLAAIGIVESGKRDTTGQMAPWPWTINAEGVGQWFNSKADAIAAVRALQARGVRSIDVGCLQINLMHHPDAFASLEQAFDPVANAVYAGRFLTQLRQQTGTWPKAAAGYHSLTPEIGADYERKVMAIWQHQPGAMFASAGAAPVMTGTSWGGGGMVLPPMRTQLYGSGGGRIIPLSPLGSPMGGGMTQGRSLASYRAAPTRLAMIMPR